MKNKSKEAKQAIKKYETMRDGYGCVAPKSLVTVGEGIYVHAIGLIMPKKRKAKSK
jgi:hypothetical protein